MDRHAMLSLSPNIASLGPLALILGLALVIFALIKPDQGLARAGAVVLALSMGWRYMTWRITETVPSFDRPLDAILGWAFLTLEAATLVSSTFSLFILSRTRDRKVEATAHQGWWGAGKPPQVEILIATYNEEKSILERTISGALTSTYLPMRVWVLDDGRRPWLATLCQRMGAHYLTRDDNAHAKAGNINAAFRTLRQLSPPPDFIAVLDADFVPHKDFVSRSLALFYNPDVGLVQTPQHFFNPDPIQHNLGIGAAYPDEQRFFFDYIQPSRDAWSIAFCCGTSSMMRWQALEDIGGFPTGSVTEDFLITLRLREEGWATVYLNEALTEGLAPEGLGEYITQRGRWCLGLMQIIRGPLGPLSRNRLRLIDRVSLTDALFYWASTYPFRIACLVIPMFYWFFGITAVNAPVNEVLYYFLPYYFAMILVLNWISSGMIVPVLNDVSQLLGATEISKAVIQGLLQPKGHKFKVTTKGGDRTQTIVQWPLLKPLIIMLVLNISGLLFSALTDVVFERDPGDGRAIIIFWSFYNIVVLTATMAVCIEKPRNAEAPRISPESLSVISRGRSTPGWLMRLTPDDAWVRGGPTVDEGESLAVDLGEVGRVLASVTRIETSGFAIALRPSAQQRVAILQKLHTRVGNTGTLETNIWMVIVAIIRRAFRA
jgi:cellulose synthase (UDP-forming)